METYRFCFRNAKGKFTGAVSQPFTDDGAALRYARRLLTVHHIVEVWRGDLRVALFDARLTPYCVHWPQPVKKTERTSLRIVAD